MNNVTISENVTTTLDRAPSSIADALDISVRLGALSGWVNDRKQAVSEWVQTKAEERLAEDGAAPTWRLDEGTVLLTNPSAKPRVQDPEAFGRWYVEELLEQDPDERPAEGYVMEWGSLVARRTEASTGSVDLLTFLDEFAAAGSEGEEACAVAAALVDRVEVEERWLVGDDLLDALIEGKAHTVDDLPRVVVLDDPLVVVDRATGEAVPGTAVTAPRARNVQMRPSTATKDRMRAELDTLLGSAALTE